MNARMIVIVLASLSWGAAGCTGGGDAAPRRAFLLEGSRPADAARPDKPTMGVLKVRRFAVAPVLSEQGLLYRTGPGRYENDYYSRFLAPVGAMISELTRRYLADTGVFAAVVNDDSDVAAEVWLEGNVRAMHGDYSDASDGSDAPGRAVMSLELFLIDGRGEAKVLFHETYEAAVPLRDDTVEALVTGHEACLNEILERFEADLDRR